MPPRTKSPKRGRDDPALRMMRLGLRTQTMMAEAQTVIALRTLGLFGLWPMGAGEGSRMVTEKIQAAQEAQIALMRAAMTGADPTAMAEAALRPLRRRTRANAARLSRGKGA